MYKSFDELLKSNVRRITECGNFYYVELEPTEFYDNSMWKVDKETGEVSFMYYTDYIIDIMDKAREINPLMLKRAS